jgi:hypothetical protein
MPLRLSDHLHHNPIAVPTWMNYAKDPKVLWYNFPQKGS